MDHENLLREIIEENDVERMRDYTDFMHRLDELLEIPFDQMYRIPQSWIAPPPSLLPRTRWQRFRRSLRFLRCPTSFKGRLILGLLAATGITAFVLVLLWWFLLSGARTKTHGTTVTSSWMPCPKQILPPGSNHTANTFYSSSLSASCYPSYISVLEESVKRGPDPPGEDEIKRLTGVEKALWSSKVTLAEDPVLDEDDGLYPPVFHNVSKFRRSYRLMEEVFRVYVYKDGYQPLFHQGYTNSIYASEGLFIDTMEKGNKFTVENPFEAHMFFLPYSMKQMVDHLHDPYTRSRKILRRVISNYVDGLISTYPFWNRIQGRDHFFVSCHDWALSSLADHKVLQKNVVKVVCNADLTEGFRTNSDVSLPETYIHGSNLNLFNFLYTGGPSAGKRPFLAFFAGQMHGSLRPNLVQHLKDKDPSMRIFDVLQSAGHGNLSYTRLTKSYAEHMRHSKYCICPRGFTVNSPRLVEAIYYECVPVIIADNFVLPFSDVLDWNKFSVTVLEQDVPNLKDILISIPQELYSSMQSRLKYVRRHFLWHDEPVQYDIFNMIVHSLWTQRLNQL